MLDPKIEELIHKEQQRQNGNINLIASENYCSQAVMRATGSCFTNKYAEGYPDHRYYSGCKVIDKGELLAQERIINLFTCQCDKDSDQCCKQASACANVQPHSGSQANAAVFLALVPKNGRILGMGLSAGGHLTHGHRVNFSGLIYQGFSYGVTKTGEIDYDQVRQQAQKIKPHLIICGASAYSLTIDFKKFRIIAEEVGAYLLADVAHIAGLIAAGCHPNPAHDVDVITFTTHKTMRGPRGGVIMCRPGLEKKINRAVFPGTQGGPLENIILAKAQAFYEAAQPSFRNYQQQVIKNVQSLVAVFNRQGCKVVGQKSVNHLVTIDTKASFGLTGLEMVTRLEEAGIIANKNMIPFDSESPYVTSGIRIGTPAMTTRGFKEHQFQALAQMIIDIGNQSQSAFEQEITK